MNIDEACINHNALKLIEEELASPYDYLDQDENQDRTRIITLGEITGIILMANQMKEVLKV